MTITTELVEKFRSAEYPNLKSYLIAAGKAGNRDAFDYINGKRAALRKDAYIFLKTHLIDATMQDAEDLMEGKVRI